MLQVTKMLSKMMKSFLPAIDELQRYMMMMSDLNLGASNEFSEVRTLKHLSVNNRAVDSQKWSPLNS